MPERTNVRDGIEAERNELAAQNQNNLLWKRLYHFAGARGLYFRRLEFTGG